MKTIERVITTDGGALDLATAILTIAYNLPRNPGAADSLREKLGLGNAVVHSTETAFSYPNAVALVRDDRGRKAVYVYDSDQETLTEGGKVAEMDPNHPMPFTYLPDEIDPVKDAAPAAPAPAPAPPLGVADVPATAPAAPEPTPIDQAFTDAGNRPVGEVQAVGDTQADREPQTIEHDDTGTLSDIGIQPAPVSGDITGTHAETLAPTPGLTPGYPADAVSGEPVSLSAEEHAKLAEVTIQADGDGTGNVLAQGHSSDPLAEGDVAHVAALPGLGEAQQIEASPGLGAGGVQASAGAPPMPPAIDSPVDQSGGPDKLGAMAFEDGKPRDANPFPMATPAYTEWQDGYDRAVDAQPQSKSEADEEHAGKSTDFI